MNRALILRSLGVLGILIGAPGCDLIQTENSFSGDAELYAVIDGSPEFLAVREVMTTYCTQCHTNFAGYSQQDFIDNGYVAAGSPAESLIYTKLRGSNSGGDENMPPASTLSTADLKKFSDWITGI